MRLSAKTGVALTITALSLVVTVGPGTAQPDPLTEKGPIPYFSDGIGVDQTPWGGQVSLVLVPTSYPQLSFSDVRRSARSA